MRARRHSIGLINRAQMYKLSVFPPNLSRFFSAKHCFLAKAMPPKAQSSTLRSHQASRLAIDG